MIPRWTRIHAALGDAPGSLTFQHVVRAVEAKLPEADDLDWKSALPQAGSSGDHQKDEFAKDVAAMANSGGGLIVYGVSELRGAGTAEELKPLGAREVDLRALRAVAGSRIRPTVLGLDVFMLGSDQDPGAVVVVSVLASQDSPHFLGDGQNGQNLGVPYRSGPETHWMRERDLERAYRERFDRRRSESRSLALEIDELRDSIDFERGAWIVVAAKPHQPSPSSLPDPQRDQVTEALQQALAIGRGLNFPKRTELLSDLGEAIHNPRVGLRRWVVQRRETGSPDDKSRYGLAELHHDGTVVFASALEGWYPPGVEDKHNVPAPLVEGFAVDVVALLEGVTRVLGHGPNYSYRVDLLRINDQKPFALVDHEQIGGMIINTLRQPPWSRTVRRFGPILGEYLALGDEAAQKEAASTVALNVVNQFGIDKLRTIV